MQKKQNESKPNKKPLPDNKKKEQQEVERFKRKYFDYYDDIKISVKEDW